MFDNDDRYAICEFTFSLEFIRDADGATIVNHEQNEDVLLPVAPGEMIGIVWLHDFLQDQDYGARSRSRPISIRRHPAGISFSSSFHRLSTAFLYRS